CWETTVPEPTPQLELFVHRAWSLTTRARRDLGGQEPTHPQGVGITLQPEHRWCPASVATLQDAAPTHHFG
ncbi:hypothetical protein P7K49_014849, partial [Saguinus oedipus]